MQALVSALWLRHRPAVLLVTHDVDEALLMADRALVLAGGRIGTEVAVRLPRPRRHADPGFCDLRSRLLLALGVDEAAPDAGEGGGVTERQRLQSRSLQVAAHPG
jgi:sulfonate transport system ATP-binding protein